MVIERSLENGSISPTFYEKLLRAQIPKVQKESEVISIFLRFWDLYRVKAACKTLVKLT